jgi:hypothetical protein
MKKALSHQVIGLSRGRKALKKSYYVPLSMIEGLSFEGLSKQKMEEVRWKMY